jgi:hypothetical protein
VRDGRGRRRAAHVQRPPVSRTKAAPSVTHPRVGDLGFGSGSLIAQQVLGVPQSIASPLDVEDMGFVQEPAEDSRGGRFVSGEDFAPVADALVGRDQRGVTTVAVCHEAEEQARFLARHPFEPEFGDDQQRGREVLASSQPGRANYWETRMGSGWTVERRARQSQRSGAGARGSAGPVQGHLRVRRSRRGTPTEAGSARYCGRSQRYSASLVARLPLLKTF